MIHVSMDGGDVWNMAQLPVVNHEQFYSILTANQDMVFMHVDDPGGQTLCRLVADRSFYVCLMSPLFKQRAQFSPRIL